MTNHRLAADVACFLSLIVAVPTALADSPCNAGYRDTTAAERAKMTAVLETIRSAMPAPAEGWKTASDDKVSVPQSMCQDFKRVPLDYHFTRYDQNVDRMLKNQKLIDERAATDAEAMKSKQPRLEAIQAKVEKVSAQQIALIQKGDFAGAEKFNAEIEKLQADFQKVADEGNDPERAEAFAKEMNRDTDMTIEIRVNPMTARVPTEAKPAAPPAGAKAAYRWHVEDSSSSNDHALFTFGSWFERPDGSLQPAAPPNAPPSAPHGFTIEITGDAARVNQAVAAIDFAKIGAVAK